MRVDPFLDLRHLFEQTYSCWMAGFNINPDAFVCDADTFAAQLAQSGISGIGTGRYYLMPAGLEFLQKQVGIRDALI